MGQPLKGLILLCLWSHKHLNIPFWRVLPWVSGAHFGFTSPVEEEAWHAGGAGLDISRQGIGWLPSLPPSPALWGGDIS